MGRAVLVAALSSTFVALATLLTACGAEGLQTPAAQTTGVLARVSVDRPIFTVNAEIDVTFAATNLSNLPIRMTALREETVLVINGKEWPDSAFTFANGIHDTNQFLAPGKSMLFTYRLTNVFKKPRLYRIVWRGKGFESLPVEFRVTPYPF
jgi:hypothetical protein